MAARASEPFSVGHAVEIAALERHHPAPWAPVAKMHPRSELRNPVRGRGEYLLLEALKSGLRAEA
eukprot:11166216-Lingulodinium_polyedra.AAC.1